MKLLEVLRFDLDLSLRFVSLNKSRDDDYSRIRILVAVKFGEIKFCYTHRVC